MKSATETEIKLRVADRPAIQERLHNAAFRISVPRLWEANELYDTADYSLRAKDTLLRLRQAGEKSVITWKGPDQSSRYKRRRELETAIGSVETLQQIFEQLGYTRVFRYEKFRTEYVDDSAEGVVTLDETPIGDFLEIEGPGDWIDVTAGRLGYDASGYVIDSYGKLYLDYCRMHGLEPGNMVFASHG